MASSEAEICNMALIQCGAARILSLNDNTVEAKLCKDMYPLVRDELLRSHPWKFAKVHASLAQVAVVTPDFMFNFSYQLPADCMRVIKMQDDGSWRWQVVGDKLMTDASYCNVEYIKRVLPGQMDPSFVDALAAKLAYKLSFTLVQSVTLRAELKQEAKDSLTQARSFNGQEGAGDRVYADDWLNSRA